jgi:hypothetical protein
MRYEMTGAQRIKLSDGRWITTGSGEFDAELEAVEHLRFVKAGCIRPVVSSEPVVISGSMAGDPAAVPEHRSRLRRFIDPAPPQPAAEEAQEE